jgi:hypothetical protein
MLGMIWSAFDSLLTASVPSLRTQGAHGYRTSGESTAPECEHAKEAGPMALAQLRLALFSRNITYTEPDGLLSGGVPVPCVAISLDEGSTPPHPLLQRKNVCLLVDQRFR